MIFTHSQGISKRPLIQRAKLTLFVSLTISVALSVFQAPAARADLLPQESFAITSTSGYVGVPLVLTTEGGSGTGEITFRLQYRASQGNNNCILTPPSYSASGEWEILKTDGYGGSFYDWNYGPVCRVVATKASDGIYSATVNFSIIYFDYIQPQVPIVLTSVIGKVGQPLPITYSGGSGDGALTYSVQDGTGRGCAIINNQIIEHGIGTCVVTIAKAASSGYLEASSEPTTVSFVAQVIAKSEKAKSGTQGSP